ncbi:13415_t:CDS:2, partial [Cetraspora pellucida]
MSSRSHKHILLAGQEWCMKDSGCRLVELNKDRAAIMRLSSKEQKQQTHETKESVVNTRNPKLAAELRELFSLMLAARSKYRTKLQNNTSETKVRNEKSIKCEDADSKESEMEIDSGVTDFDRQRDVSSERSYEKIRTHNAMSNSSNPSSGAQPDSKASGVEQIKLVKNN